VTISKDLMLSILAMDAYNQGAGGLNFSQVGTATVFRRTISDPSSGFYAIAYMISGGVDGLAANSIVIAYRGTR
jgi:hypothetical protein